MAAQVVLICVAMIVNALFHHIAGVDVYVDSQICDQYRQ